MFNKYNAAVFFIIISCLFTSCGIKRHALLPQLSQNAFYQEYPRLCESQIDSLRGVYGNNKVFCDAFIEPTLIALSYFPELKDTRISFEYSQEATTMAARPKPMSMFAKRQYLVLINNEADFEGILLKNVPFNAQIGIIGHELAHIVDYQNRNFWGVMAVLFRYADKKRKPLFEKEIDYATILRGLGWQLYDWAVFSMNSNPYATEQYKEFKRETYMQPDQIKEVMFFLGRYGQGIEK